MQVLITNISPLVEGYEFRNPAKIFNLVMKYYQKNMKIWRGKSQQWLHTTRNYYSSSIAHNKTRNIQNWFWVYNLEFSFLESHFLQNSVEKVPYFGKQFQISKSSIRSATKTPDDIDHVWQVSMHYLHLIIDSSFLQYSIDWIQVSRVS